MVAEQKNIKVVVRVRPYNRKEVEQNQRTIIKVMDNTTLLFDPDEEDDEFFYQGTKHHYRDLTKKVNKKLSMEFDRVFDTETSNKEIFEECTSPLVDSVLNGYNVSVFVYGATGAGKTFTMLGSDSLPGLTFLTMQDLFEKIHMQSDSKKFEVGVSYLEVYNEQVMNLLTKTGPLKLREDSNGVVVSGLALKPIRSAAELLHLLSLGNSNRTQHPTDANAESSRSHAVFQVHIRMSELKTGIKRTVKLSMIDLAGSERAASTKGIGVRFKEGASINKSLLALGNCINKLADGLKHIPYRDSNLTRILKDSLGGNCQTLMVANVSMSSLTYEDTYNTLKYASRAKKIRTTLRQNALKSNMPKEFYVKKASELMAENERLKAANTVLENKLAQKTSNANNSRSINETELKTWYSKIDAVYSSVIKSQEYVLSSQSKIKNLNIRTKMKQTIDKIQKIFVLNNSNISEDLSHLASSCQKVNKQVEESKRWRKKLQDAYKDLEKLKKEIRDAKYADILQIYIKGKDIEIQNSKQNSIINHISLINSELFNTTQCLSSVHTSACEVLQKWYETDPPNVFPELLQSLKDLQEKTHTMFANNDECKDDYKKDSDDDLNAETMETNVKLLLNGKRLNNSTDDADDELPTSSSHSMMRNNKRYKFDNSNELGLDTLDDETDSDECGFTFKRPFNKQRNMNETHVLTACDAEFTFDLGSTSGAIANSTVKKKNLVSNILSDRIATIAPSNKDRVKKVLLKSNTFSHHGLLKAVAAGVQKENKKFSPNLVRKSPRSISTKNLPSTTNFIRKQTIRSNNSTDPPLVRINRAASFRVKK